MGNSFFDGLKDSFEIDFYMTGLVIGITIKVCLLCLAIYFAIYAIYFIASMIVGALNV